MDHFFIIANHTKEPSVREASAIKKYLEERGKVCYVQNGIPCENTGAYRFTDPAEIPPDTQCVLVLGGDGTLLQAARDLTDTSYPLLGINMGRLGYLAEIELVNVYSALDRLMADQYTVENRMMLSGICERKSAGPVVDVALNDIVISRRGRLRVVDFKISVNGEFLCSYRADGIILSTATGSTGYSLSAGGPIVSPDAFLQLLTPISPHTLNSRPVVLPDTARIHVQLGGSGLPDEEGADVTFDGDTAAHILPGDGITVSRSEKTTRLIKVNNTSFVEILRKKMN